MICECLIKQWFDNDKQTKTEDCQVEEIQVQRASFDLSLCKRPVSMCKINVVMSLERMKCKQSLQAFQAVEVALAHCCEIIVRQIPVHFGCECSYRSVLGDLKSQTSIPDLVEVS